MPPFDQNLQLIVGAIVTIVTLLSGIAYLAVRTISKVFNHQTKLDSEWRTLDTERHARIVDTQKEISTVLANHLSQIHDMNKETMLEIKHGREIYGEYFKTTIKGITDILIEQARIRGASEAKRTRR